MIKKKTHRLWIRSVFKCFFQLFPHFKAKTSKTFKWFYYYKLSKQGRTGL